MIRTAIFLGLAVCIGCGGGGGGGAIIVVPLQGAPLVLAAGMQQLEPAADDSWAAGVDLQRLGIDNVADVYDLTTPAGEPFTFDLLSRGQANSGAVRVSVAHASDGGLPPTGGAETLAEVGVVPSATGTQARGPWLDAIGDGFARISLRGEIARDQIFAVEVHDGDEPRRALVRVRIGPESPINVPEPPDGEEYPGVKKRVCIYSSDSWLFGLPTVAVSGDRASIVVYEGDRGDPHRYDRYELRMQYDCETGELTGGGSDEVSPDSGNWRDHEIAALFNVLALVHSGTDAVTVKLSFDRGATFAQTETLQQAIGFGNQRLAQIAIAADYTLAILYWRNNRDDTTDLVLVEGRPSAFDQTGSPTRFEFDPAQVLYHDRGDVTPMIMGATFSDGGDLVVGYAFSRFDFSDVDFTWTSVTQYRVAVRLFGSTFCDRLVEEDLIVGRDPSVAVIGQGASMQVYYAYEMADGVALRTGTGECDTFSPPIVVGDRGAHMPTVLAREQGVATRVDLLYLAQGEKGTELHLRHWDDYGTSAPEDYRLTEAELIESRNAPPPVPGILPPDYGFRIKQIAWFGYDAVLDGDDIVVVYDEQTYDSYAILTGPPLLGLPVADGLALPAAGAAEFVQATPPPLAAGMILLLDLPDDSHMHQLKILVLD